MTQFEITGETVTGSNDQSHSDFLLEQVRSLEEFARTIGKSIGMATVDRGVVTHEEQGYGFRFASTSDDQFDAKGVEIEGVLLPSEVVPKLT